jgi:hypothetical protein
VQAPDCGESLTVLADLDAELHLARARMALRNATAVVAHPGADGLAAAAIALGARGERARAAVLPDGDPFDPATPLPDGPLAILDWGLRAIDRPGVLVDHVMPETAPRDDQVFLSGYGEIPVIPTAALLRRVHGEAPLWLAEIGIAKEIGADHVGQDVRQLTALVDAPRRVPDGPVTAALEVLTRHGEVADALADERIAELDAARRAWKAALERVIRIEPEQRGDVAIVRFESDYVVEDVVARSWALRLPAFRVVAIRNGDQVAGDVQLVRGRGVS